MAMTCAKTNGIAISRMLLRQFKDRRDWVGQECFDVQLALAKQIFDVPRRPIAHLQPN